MSVPSDDPRWPALLRGQILSATVNKFSVIIRLVDQKAQVMILLNSFLVPMCMNALQHGSFIYAASISVITSVLSILAAIVCIYPKRRHRKKCDKDLNLLHFNDIGHLGRDEYYEMFLPVLNSPEKLCALVVQDLHDTSRNSIKPKFVWLKISYGIFAVGNLIALVVAMARL